LESVQNSFFLIIEHELLMNISYEEARL